jgi:hypothetical protein
MDWKLEQFLQKSGFTKTHISEKVRLGFSSNFAKNYFNIWIPPVFKKAEFYFVSKWRLCSKWPQKFSFFTITQPILKNFMFSLLILVNGHIPHKS